MGRVRGRAESQTGKSPGWEEPGALLGRRAREESAGPGRLSLEALLGAEARVAAAARDIGGARFSHHFDHETDGLENVRDEGHVRLLSKKGMTSVFRRQEGKVTRSLRGAVAGEFAQGMAVNGLDAADFALGFRLVAGGDRIDDATEEAALCRLRLAFLTRKREKRVGINTGIHRVTPFSEAVRQPPSCEPMAPIAISLLPSVLCFLSPLNFPKRET